MKAMGLCAGGGSLLAWRPGLWGLALALLLRVTGASAQGTETTTYSYDALGRLVGVAHQGGPENGVQVGYEYDKADNRKRVVVTGASANGGGGNNGNPSANHTMVVMPNIGFFLISR